MALWTPADLANSKAWFVADNPSNTLVSGELSVIADKSGAGYHATALSAATRGAFSTTLNSRNVWHSGTGKTGAFNLASGANALSNAASGLTIFAVHRMNSPTSVDDNVIAHWSRGGAVNARFTFSRANNSAGGVDCGTRRLDSDGYQGLGDNTNYGTAWKVLGGVINYSAGTGLISVDGTATSSGSLSWAGGSGNTSATDSAVTAIGHYDSGSDAGWFDQDIAELVMIRGALGTTDRQLIEGYLAWQWALQSNLPGGHPYKSAAPTTGSTISSADADIQGDWASSIVSQKLLGGLGDLSGTDTDAYDGAKIRGGDSVLHNSGETDLFVGTGVGGGAAALSGNDTTLFTSTTFVGAVWAASNDLAALFDSNAIATGQADLMAVGDASVLFLSAAFAGMAATIDGLDDTRLYSGATVGSSASIDGVGDLLIAPSTVFSAVAVAVMDAILNGQGIAVSIPTGVDPAGLLRVMRRPEAPRLMQRPPSERKMTR
ncbi:hypothetical protein [Variovorax sp. dw_954]|uniref:hypothetical protein n=1 Tax=Variovorax sp. dw_954 TaxID=2720078 RepID=UPI001BD6ABA8|nr:hypothetical protein [Variovorax sp. dw_954]